MSEKINCGNCGMLLYFGEEIKRRLYMRAIPDEAALLASYNKTPANHCLTQFCTFSQVSQESRLAQSGLITEERDELMEHFALGARDLVVSVEECIAKRKRLGAEV